MSALALRLNDIAPSLPQLTPLFSAREMRRTAASAKQWLLGTLGEAVIGLSSHLYGLPAPAKLMRALTEGRGTRVSAAAEPAVEAPRIAAEIQWERPAEILASLVSGANAAGQLHAAAAEQLDAADYALRLLHDDIDQLMIFSREDDEPEFRWYPKRASRGLKAELPGHDALEHVAA